MSLCPRLASVREQARSVGELHLNKAYERLARAADVARAYSTGAGATVAVATTSRH